MKSEETIDRRRYPRREVQLFVRYKNTDAPDDPWATAQVRGISFGGMLFTVSERFSMSTRLLFRLQMFVGGSVADDEDIEFRAEVLGSEEAALGYDTRVAFIDLDEMTTTRIKGFIDCIS